MPDDPTLTITVVRRADEFAANLHAESGMNGVADLRLRGIGRSVSEAVQICVTELESKAADGDKTALRFA
jgi:hypothetical protein